MKYLKQFIIGSSYPVFVSYFYAVSKAKVKNYSYQSYTFVAPVWLGLWNVISLLIAESFNLTMEMRFLVVSIISSLSIMAISTKFNTYNFSRKEWFKYYFRIFIKYLIILNIIVYNIEKSIE